MSRTTLSFELLESRQMLAAQALPSIGPGWTASDGGPQALGNFMGQPRGNYGNLPFPPSTPAPDHTTLAASLNTATAKVSQTIHLMSNAHVGTTMTSLTARGGQIPGPIGNPPVLGGSGVIRPGGPGGTGGNLPGPIGNPPVLGGHGVIRPGGPGGTGGQIPGPVGNPPVLGASGVVG